MAEMQTFSTTAENATHLLAAAAELGLDRHVVKVTSAGLQAPDEVVKLAAKRLKAADTEAARSSEIAESTPAPAKKRAAKKTTARTTAKDKE